MKLEDQVTSLEISKKLKELGVKQESLFWWTRTFTRKSGEYKEDSEWYLQFKKNGIGGHYSAFTVAELGELLPNASSYMQEKSTYFDSFKTSSGTWTVRYYIENELKQAIVGAKTESIARAKMLIYLLEQKLIVL